MILFKFYIAFFAIFISPILFYRYKFNKENFSLILLYSFITSFTIVWAFIFISYFLKIPNSFYFYFCSLLILSSFTYIFLNRYKQFKFDWSYIIIFSIVLYIITQLLPHLGHVYHSWDAVVAWHRWALELYNNEYHPIDAAYPVMLPAMWAFFYKVQGTSDIWWTVQFLQGILPVYIILVLSVLFKEYKKISYLLMGLLIYPYILFGSTYNGDMDMPVMLAGFLSLITLYTAEINKETPLFNKYISLAILIAGIASIIKQSGLVFLVFTLLYTFLQRDKITNKKQIILVILISLSFFSTYLVLYSLNSLHSVTGNLQYLQSLSNKGLTSSKNIIQILHSLYSKYTSYPYTSYLAYFNKLNSTVILIIIGYSLLYLKDIRKKSALGTLSAIFFPLGVLAWIFFFSYDARNSYWTRSFLIILVSINLSSFFELYFYKIIHKFKLIYLFIFIVLLVGIKLITVNDQVLYEKQINSQKTIGEENVAKYISEILEGTQCLSVYTDDYYMKYNYYLHNFQDRLHAFIPVYKILLINHIEHNCEEGRYFIFRVKDVFYPDWWKVEKLIAHHYLYPINFQRGVYIYFAPPHQKIPKDFFIIYTKFKNKLAINKNPLPLKYFYIDKFIVTNEFINIQGWGFPNDIPNANTVKYILLENSQKRYIIQTENKTREDVVRFFKKQNINPSKETGFITYINPNDIKEGTYKVKLLIENLDTSKQFVTTLPKTITIHKREQ